MTPIHAALYARISSAQQAEAHTVARQVAALRERVAAPRWQTPCRPCWAGPPTNGMSASSRNSNAGSAFMRSLPNRVFNA